MSRVARIARLEELRESPSIYDAGLRKVSEGVRFANTIVAISGEPKDVIVLIEAGANHVEQGNWKNA